MIGAGRIDESMIDVVTEQYLAKRSITDSSCAALGTSTFSTKHSSPVTRCTYSISGMAAKSLRQSGNFSKLVLTRAIASRSSPTA